MRSRLQRLIFLSLLFLLAPLTGPVQSTVAQTFLGNYSGYKVNGKAISVSAGSASIRFIFYQSDILRVDFLPTPATLFDSSFVVIRDTAQTVGVTILSTDSTLEIASSAIKIVCRKNPLRLACYTGAGKALLAEPNSGGLSTNGAARTATFSLSADDHFYGTGERGIGLDLRGNAFDSYNTQIGGYGEQSGPLPTMNINVPFVTSTNGYALYFENTYPGRFDFGVTDPGNFSYRASGGELSYFLIAGATIREQLEKYTWLTGRQPLPPRWAFGFIQSKYGYKNDVEAYTMVQTMRQKQIPCDAMVLDLYWFNAMGDIRWNPVSWPDPFHMMDSLLARGIKTIVITEPYIVQHSINFPEARDKGYLGTYSNGQPYVLSGWWSCGGCNAYLLDLTNPSAQTWWWSKHPGFAGNQLAGFWTDLGEPERHPSDMVHSLGSAAKIHNIYNLFWAKSIFEGYSQLRPNQRLFNITRSGYAGIQRYGAILWSGDVGKDFSGLSVQLPMVLNMGLSGLAYHNSDIGGFCCGNTTPELYVRWMQYGTFCPITRAHGRDAQPTEPWGYGAQAESIVKQYIQLRYQLLPYIYTMAHQNNATGTPLARPLVFSYPEDTNLCNESSTYSWGDAFLVSPVVQEGQTSKTVTLPPGKWINYWTEQTYVGGQSVVVEAPLETLPLFVKAGSIIPMQPVMNYTDEHPLDTLILRVYPSTEGVASYTLYEDDGKTLSYQVGEFAQTIFTQHFTGSGAATTMDVHIGRTEGTYAGKPSQRAYITEVRGIAGAPGVVRKNGTPLAERTSYQQLRENGDGFFHDSGGTRLFIHTVTVPDSDYELVAENIRLSTDVGRSNAPREFTLEQNYPNPFNPATEIRFSVPREADVSLKVYDVLGREVATLANGPRYAGNYTAIFDASIVVKNGLSSGIYFYTLKAGVFRQTRKMVLAK